MMYITLSERAVVTGVYENIEDARATREFVLPFNSKLYKLPEVGSTYVA